MRELYDKLDEATTQLRRIAYALEMRHFIVRSPSEYIPCVTCGCSIIPREAQRCPVCGAQTGTPEGEQDGDGGKQAQRP